jgi:hypothetical protein
MTIKARRDRVRDSAITIYVNTLRRNNQAFNDIKEQAERTISYCKQKGYSEPKFAIRVLDLVKKQLDFIVCREAELKALRRDVAEGQLGLADIPTEDARETVPDDESQGPHPGYTLSEQQEE